jgi:7,8-dihydroneopterin aldolase/epimerase/oxygenase
VTDRILMANMQFQGRHGVYDYERLNPQRFEVDLELVKDLQPAGLEDDLEQTVDYGKVFDAVRQIVESTSYRLLEALAEAISHELLADFSIDEVTVRVRKPEVRLSGPLDYAGVEIVRRRGDVERRS